MFDGDDCMLTFLYITKHRSHSTPFFSLFPSFFCCGVGKLCFFFLLVVIKKCISEKMGENNIRQI